MPKNNKPIATEGWGVQRRKPACLCIDGETYKNECCEGYLINQGIGRTQGSDPFQQNLLKSEQATQGVPQFFILWQNDQNERGSVVWGPNI